MSKGCLPPPNILGLPAKFNTWRPAQEEAVLEVCDTDKRTIVQVQPTGAGKSLCYVAAAVVSGQRTVILTSLKGLQAQLERDFGKQPGLAVVMGKNAYKCHILMEDLKAGKVSEEFTTCDWGPCNFGRNCRLKKDGGCEYYDAIATAKASPIVVTNYSFWVANKPGTLGDFDLLVCDEAHDAKAKLLDSLSVKLTKKSFERAKIDEFSWPRETWDDQDLWEWSWELIADLEDQVKQCSERSSFSELMKSNTFRAQYLLCQRLSKIKDVIPEQWVVEQKFDEITFDPLWPAQFAEGYLFQKTPNILMISATISKKSLELLGLHSDDYHFHEYPSHFPLKRRPIYTIPTAFINHRVTPGDLRIWLNRIDQIIRPRQGRKGIIHTVSYGRADMILQASQFRSMMMTHKAGDLLQTIEEFKRSKKPCILVSPSVMTGFDFPYKQCEYQIIVKVPFPDQRSKVDRMRCKIDKEYGIDIAAQNLQQAAGRGMRAADDQCETFIIDNQISWFAGKYGHFMAQWFRRAIQSKMVLPAPLPLIEKQSLVGV